ncbi:uncharacterized protein LOC114130112 [Aphis gossypii]|uniref:uncharacterized protein LOC114130112 n=1 Tax=Aphis gossypii TaxID=80765 RepID=UPI002158DE35|nr:uncharacterized protein LOC114130112 [Aphis gossypii]
MDFNQLYPQKNQNLIQKFDIFKDRLKMYLKNRTNNFNLNQQNLVKTILSADKIGDDDLAAILLLPYLFNPVNIKIPKKTTDNNVSKYSMRRPTKLEQASAVVVCITNINDLKTTHEEKVNRAFNCGLTVQPYVVIVGNLEEINSTISYYTVINDIHYKLETPIKALDICFKSFHSFNLEYPQEAEQVWWFIQDYFFNINNNSKKKFISVQTLIKDLE